MNKIPDPIFLEILDYLPLRDLLMLRRTNSGLNRMLKAAGGPVVVLSVNPISGIKVGFKGTEYCLEQHVVYDTRTQERIRRHVFLGWGTSGILNQVRFRTVHLMCPEEQHWRVHLLEDKNETVRKGNAVARLATLRENSELRMWQGFPFY